MPCTGRLWRAVVAAAVAAAALALAGPSPSAQSIDNRVNTIFAAWNKKDTPGCALGVAQTGEPVLLRSFGMADLENDRPIAPETIFEAGSVSKQFTAAAINLLALDGKLSLDDPARKYLPELPAIASGIRLRHLLTHTSGLRSQWPLLTLAGRPPGEAVHSIPEILDLVSRQQRLNFEPGDDFLYNNTAFTLLSVVVARVSGQSFQQFCDARLFKPIGMNSTRWREDHTAIVRNRATAYTRGSDAQIHSDMSFTDVVGNGGLLTTVKDLLAWNENLDTARVGGRAFVESLHTRGRLNDGFVNEYAQGLYVRTFQGVKEVSHGGSTAGYRSFLARYPDQRLSVAVLCNVASANPERLGHEVAQLYLRDALKAPGPLPAATVATEALRARTGLYRDPTTDAVLKVTVDQGKVRIGSTEVVPLSEQRFRGAGTITYEFVMENGAVKRLSELADGARPREYLPVPVATPSASDLAGYAGRYFSAELEVFYTVTVEKDALVVKRQWERRNLQPAFADAFEMGGGRVLRFTRRADGAVDGFEIFAGRVRHVRFEKQVQARQ